MCQKNLSLPRNRNWRVMIARAISANVPFSWVAAGSVYGVGAIEQNLRRAGKGYVLGGVRRLDFIHGARRP
jgi:SRSO17 transposase